MTILAVWALLLTAAPVTHPAVLTAPANAAVSAVVIVKLGPASREEYRHGDPQNRVQLLRSR